MNLKNVRKLPGVSIHVLHAEAGNKMKGVEDCRCVAPNTNDTTLFVCQYLLRVVNARRWSCTYLKSTKAVCRSIFIGNSENRVQSPKVPWYVSASFLTNDLLAAYSEKQENS